MVIYLLFLMYKCAKGETSWAKIREEFKKGNKKSGDVKTPSIQGALNKPEMKPNEENSEASKSMLATA